SRRPREEPRPRFRLGLRPAHGVRSRCRRTALRCAPSRSRPRAQGPSSFLVTFSPLASFTSLVERELARADRHSEPILARRQRAAPRIVVRAVGVVGAIEVELEAAVSERLRFNVAARTVGLAPACRVAEWDEESVALRERGKAGALAAHVEAHLSRTRKMFGRAIAHLDLFDRACPLGIDRHRKSE